MRQEKPSYKILARYMSGVEVAGYLLEGPDGNRHAISQLDTHRLALENRISNCKAQVYQGKVNMKGIGGCKLSELPTLDSITGKVKEESGKTCKNAANLQLVARIVEGRNIIGYRLMDKDKNCKNIRKEEVLTLAKEGLIENVRMQMNNGVPLLRGVNYDLAKVPTIRI